MSTGIKNFIVRAAGLLSLAAGISLVPACTGPQLTDTTEFAIYYSGVTDIGPSMNFNLGAPTYIGEKPTDFAIYLITLDGETIESDCFTIKPETGEISLSNTEGIRTGTYSLSISCTSGGKYYEFPNAVTVNMMNAVPDGITVDPAVLDIKLKDITDPAAVLPTAQVTTEGNHISITSYAISAVRKDGVAIENDGYFLITKEGVISVERNEEIEPGSYVFDIKLSTRLTSEDEPEMGLFENALTVNITSEPLALTYSPASSRVEFGAGFTSSVPELRGSLDDLSYSVKSLSIPDAPVTIDEKTGAISIAEGNTLDIGDVCKVTVTATNKYGTADFADVYSIEIVDFINPISSFEYNAPVPAGYVQGGAFSLEVKTMDGDEVTYSFVDLPAELSSLKVDPLTGTVSAAEGNSIPIGSYSVTVLAKNIKSEKTAVATFEIVDNPYFFTYVHYGNNLGLEPQSDYASMLRIDDDLKIADFEWTVADSDIPEGVPVSWEIENLTATKDECEVTIDENGTIRFGKKRSNTRVDGFIVTTTVGKGYPGETVVKTPVFIHRAKADKSGVTIQYTPFVAQINPNAGGRSAAPEITGTDLGSFIMDYRRNFDYWNLDGPAQHVNGRPNVSGSFMNSLWIAAGSGNNTGARKPMSYIDNVGNTGLALGYVDPDDNAVVINPYKFTNDYGPANGIFLGTMTYATDGNTASVSGGTESIQLFIWFDTDFK